MESTLNIFLFDALEAHRVAIILLLIDFSKNLRDVDKEVALALDRQAMELSSALVRLPTPNKLSKDLACSLERVTGNLFRLGESKLALDILERAVTILRRLMDENPSALDADFAQSLGKMSIHLRLTSRKSEALSAVGEAVDLGEIIGQEPREIRCGEQAKYDQQKHVKQISSLRRRQAIRQTQCWLAVFNETCDIPLYDKWHFE